MTQGPQLLTAGNYDVVCQLADSSRVGLMLAVDAETGLPLYDDRTAAPFEAGTREGAVGYETFPPGIDTALAQDDWEFGLGHQDVEGDNPRSARQLASMTNIAVEHRIATLAPRVEAAQAGGSFTPSYFLTTSTNLLFAFAGASVYQYNTGTSTWDLKDTMAGSVSGPPVEFDGTIFVPLGSSTAYESSSDDFATAGVASTLADPNATGFAVYHNSSNVPLLVRWDDTNEVKTNTSGLNGGAAWSGATKIGNTSAAITWILPMGGSARLDNLLVFKTDGRYTFDEAGTVADENPDYRAAPYASYGVGGVVYRDRTAIYPTRNALVRWNPFGDTEQDVIYPPSHALGTRKNIGQPQFVAAGPDAIYTVILNTDGEYRLLRGRPSGFQADDPQRHEAWIWDWCIDLGANACDVMHYVPSTANGTSNDWLVIRRGSSARHIILPRVGLIATQDGNCRFASAGTMLCPTFDANLVEQQKAVKYLRADGRQITASAVIKFGYLMDPDGELEDQTYTGLGIFDNSASSGFFQQSVPASTTGFRLATRIELNRGGGEPENTPILTGYAWHVNICGPSIKQRRFTVQVDTGLAGRAGQGTDQTAAYIMSKIEAAARQVAPPRWRLPDGSIVDAKVDYTSLRFITLPQAGAQPTMKRHVEIGITDATENGGSSVIYGTGKRYGADHTYGRAS